MQSATLITITLLIASSMALPFPSLNLLNPLLRVPDDRIVGGNVTEIEEFPYIASLQRYGMHTCGCNIISSNFLLTAAHCTYGASASMFTVRLGTSFQSSGGEMIYVKSIMQHKQFDYRSVDFDYSILELVSPIEFDKTKQPIALPKQNEEVEDGAVVVTSGWGNTQSSSESNKQLRTVDVPVVNSNVCVQAYKGMGEVTPRMICAGFEKGGKGRLGFLNF